MSNAPKALLALAAVAFLLAVVGSVIDDSIMRISPEGYSRACTNLALLAVGIALAWTSGSSSA